MRPQFLTHLQFLYVILITFVGIALPAQAESPIPLSSIQQAFPALSPTEVAQLQKEGEITRYFFESSPLQWLPREGLAIQIAAEASRIETVIGVESIHLLSLQQLRTPGIVFPETGELKQRVYNVLRSVSTMKGVQYYSVTRGKIRTLFEESYAVASAEQPERIPDPVVKEIPASSSLTVFQEDTTFGQNYSRWIYKYADDEISISITNLTPLKYSFFKMVDPEQMQIHLLVRPMEEGISFYGCAVVKSAKFLGLEKSSKESFYNRIKAIYTWFRDQLTRELQRKGEGL